MLVMFSGPGPGLRPTLILGFVGEDLVTLKRELTKEYINAPHDPQLVQDIIVCYAESKAVLLEMFKTAGVQVDELTAQQYLEGKRTDKGWTPS